MNARCGRKENNHAARATQCESAHKVDGRNAMGKSSSNRYFENGQGRLDDALLSEPARSRASVALEAAVTPTTREKRETRQNRTRRCIRRSKTLRAPLSMVPRAEMGRCLVQGVERRLLNVDFFFAVRFLACRDLFGGQERGRKPRSRDGSWHADVIGCICILKIALFLFFYTQGDDLSL